MTYRSPATIRRGHVAGAVEMTEVPVGWATVTGTELPSENKINSAEPKV